MPFARTALTTMDMDALGARVEQELRDRKGKYVFQGMGFIASGLMAIALPSTTAINVEMLVGIILLLTGIFQLVLTLKSKMHWWSLLSASLSVIVGTFILWKPFPVLLAIVTLMAVFMTAEGLLELFLAFEFRPVRNWRWMLFSGIVTLAMAVILWVGYPAFDVFYLSWIVAINLILYGLSLLMLVWRVAS